MIRLSTFIFKLKPRCYGTDMFKKFASGSVQKQPAPRKLPLKDQLEFEGLIKKANAEIIFEEYNEKLNTSEPLQNTKELEQIITERQEQIKNFKGLEEEKSSTAKTYSTNTIPEFEGNVNPKTGEVNGPKQDPLKYGDWAYNGRVTDF
ncbi:hypothetical protein FOG51_00880 [Hanseniaspora uvarum]|nr:hypothetical protein FOG48_00860 [Hanseniaspora uvarum]KAF0274245.1 hypothetical protein FOG51_00880 [Hanseniaspora uvarum]KKA02064.1 Protein FMP21, mitochondrial [Hanseniaspora uvarum DSM 2768]